MKEMKYRTDCFSMVEMKTHAYLSDIAYAVATVCFEDFNQMSSDEYREWIQHWRAAYHDLSNVISEMKKHARTESDAASIVPAMRRMANTMLNARMYARDTRRANRAAR